MAVMLAVRAQVAAVKAGARTLQRKRMIGQKISHYRVLDRLGSARG